MEVTVRYAMMGVDDGTIVDQGGPGQPTTGLVAVPTMNQWGTTF